MVGSLITKYKAYCEYIPAKEGYDNPVLRSLLFHCKR